MFPSKEAPSTASFADPRVMGLLGYERGDALKDLSTKRDRRLALRQDVHKEMQALLGTVVRDATELRTLGGGVIGPHRDLSGRIVRWSYWAPGKRLLIDRFRRELPEGRELEARLGFAEENGLTYAVVAPGKAFSVSDLKKLVDDMGGA